MAGRAGDVIYGCSIMGALLSSHKDGQPSEMSGGGIKLREERQGPVELLLGRRIFRFIDYFSSPPPPINTNSLEAFWKTTELPATQSQGFQQLVKTRVWVSTPFAHNTATSITLSLTNTDGFSSIQKVTGDSGASSVCQIYADPSGLWT